MSKMQVQMEEWRRFVPGSRMYKDKKTLFYNGEILWEGDEWIGDSLIYDEDERLSWEVIIVLPGVEVISCCTFWRCENVKTVIMADTIKSIENSAFGRCESLELVKLSTNLEFIGQAAFQYCSSLTSIYIPPSCRYICFWAFDGCKKLIILSVPHNTGLAYQVIPSTALIHASPFELDKNGSYDYHNDEVHEWIKNMNRNEEFALHRDCASMEPSEENINEIIKRQGLPCINVKNQIGLTAFEYLEKNPYTNVNEQKLINRYVLELMGEINV